MTACTRFFFAAFALGTLASTHQIRAARADATPTPDPLAIAEGFALKVSVSATHVRHMLDDARRHKDAVKSTCLSDKLMQLDVTLKKLRERQISLRAAIVRGEIDLRNHEFAVISTLRARAEKLEGDAQQCIAEPIIEPNKTKVVVVVDPNIAPIDPGTAGGATGYK